MSKSCTVYALASSEDGAVRYIGQTTGTPERRLVGHLSSARRGSRLPVHLWIAKVVANGYEVALTTLAENAAWHTTEMTIIAEYRANGARLLNLTDGGEGTIGCRSNLGKKRPDLAARNRANTGKPGRPRMPGETERLMQYSRGVKRPWVAERNRSKAGLPGHKHTEEHKEHIRRIMTGKRYSAERCQNIAAGIRAAFAAKKAAAEAAI